ncbi:unnamed protein product [Caenorhabditis angaria]|uniref:Acyl carrier protein n=1 Tax=Caenorhabditis angaria TaxID=860376 RepID=A0A9P1IM07_9PELO|nr:unnamed protein product [Caenorhabditis angaria]
MSADNVLLERIYNLIIAELGVKKEDLQLSSRFVEDLGADSLDAVELSMRIEEEFEIEIPDEDAEQIKTVQDIYNYVSTHRK